MKKRVIWIFIVLVVVGAFFGLVIYRDSEYYRLRFEAKFKTLKVGDTHQHMEDVLGPARVHCKIRTIDLSGKAPDRYTGLYEVYRIAGHGYFVEFSTPKPDPNSPIVRLLITKPNEYVESVMGC